MTHATEKAKPSAILAGFTFRNKKDPRSLLEDPLEEFRLLVHSMGSEIAGEVFQNNMKPNQRSLISPHLIELAKNEVLRTNATLLCIDDTLTGSQRAHIEDLAGCEVLDRTEVILQIFALRAQTAEGMLQVELAQLEYLRPRLKGRGGKELSALGGGIGTRGPGETKLETDRRVIGKRITVLKQKLETVKRRRDTQRKRRQQSGIPLIALVGYTNSGKTTLLNAVAGSNAYADDRLFATLDPITRRTYSPILGREVLVTDTVGFIERLPTELVASFRATLEEVNFADLLVVVVDGNDPQWQMKQDVVERTIGEIGAGNIPKMVVYNKSDLFEVRELEPGVIEFNPTAEQIGLKVSALTKSGIEEFWQEVGMALHLAVKSS